MAAHPFRGCTEAELREVVAALKPGSLREAAIEELTERTRSTALRARGNPSGTCAAGLRVYADQTGAHSSGYVCHAQDHSVCDHQPWSWDDREPFDVYLRRLGLA
jgi:hypothetical protein